MNDHFTPPPDDTAPDTRPHNIEAEQALLGAILYDNEVQDRIGPVLRPDHFSDPVHGRIYGEIARLIESGRLADAIVIKDTMASDTGLQDLGVARYLALLLESASDSVSAVEYARLVISLGKRREIIRIADEMRAAATDAAPDMNADDLITSIEGDLYALANQAAGRSYIEFSESVRQSLEMARAAHERGGVSGVTSGFKSLDTKLGGFQATDLIILAGRPGMGKSAFATNSAFALAKLNHPVGFFSLEMSAEQISTRILSDRSGIKSEDIRRGKLSRDQLVELEEVGQEVAGLPIFIDDRGGQGIGRLCAQARRMTRRHDLKVIFVDYLQLADGQAGPGANRVQELTRITTALKGLAKDLGIPVVALSQLSRQVEQRENKRPQLSDLRESGSIEQDADVVMFVYREAYYKEREKPSDVTSHDYVIWQQEFQQIETKAEVIIGKQRHGPTGTVYMGFDAAHTRFFDLETRYEHA